MRLRIATCTTLPELDVDAAPLAAALTAGGFDPELWAWDDEGVDWSEPIPTILRSTWNYSLHVERFLAWVDAAARSAPLLNPPAVVRANAHKRYLLELEARGVPVVPTALVPCGAGLDAAAWTRLGDGEVIVKPAVGAGSRGVGRFPVGERDAIATHVAELGREGDVLVQPYQPAVETAGERSLIWIDGELTHAIRKAPRLAGDAEAITGPFPITDDERAVALAALAPFARAILYGRVDLVRDAAGTPRVMELELIEPSLFFRFHPPAADRYVRGLRERLERD